MLKLMRCEFAKLKRKPLFFGAAALSALIPLGCALLLPEFKEFTSGAEAIDNMMATLFQLSAYLLLMPALVVLASNLLFEEQDNDTLKNLLVVPVSKPALAFAKMGVLFLFSIAFMAVGGFVNLAIVLAKGLEPVGFWRLFFVGLGQGIMDVGRSLAVYFSGGTAEPQLHHFCDYHVFLYGSQLHFRHKRILYYAAFWFQSRDAAAWTIDLPLVLSVSGHGESQRRDGSVIGTDRSLFYDNHPSVFGCHCRVGILSGSDRTGL